MKTRKKKFKRTFKLLTFALTLILLMSSMPLTFQAMAIETDVNIKEVEEYREEYSKHFKMPDGTYKAVSYTAPVHRMDENGEWQDLENILSENTVKNKQAYVTADGRTVFSKKISADDRSVFEINDGGYSMKVSFENENIKNSSAKLSNHAKKYQPTNTDDIETQYKKLKEIDTNTTVKYKNIIKNIDLEYVLSANDIKENIIIRKACDDYEFSFIYELEGLSATLCEDGSVAVFDSETNEVKYSIPAPYMYDDDGVESTDVTYSLDDLDNGRYRLTVAPDETWINAEDRAFPVTVDPTVTLHANLYDAYISSGNPNWNYDEDEDLWVSNSAMVFMDIANDSKGNPLLPKLPNDSIVTYATLQVRYYYYSYVKDGSMEVGLYEATFPWTESTIKWSIASQYENMGTSNVQIDSAIAFPATNITSETPGSMYFNVTNLICSWYMGKTNYGIALKRLGGSNSSIIVKSMEAGENTYSIYEIAYSSYVPVLQSGTYNVENVGTGRYIDVEGPSYSEGANIQQWEPHIGNSAKWIIETVPGEENYIRFKSAYSGMYIGVDNTFSYIKQYDTINYYTTWKVEKTSTGNYKFICKATESSGKVISVPLNSNSNGTDLVQIAYTDNSNYRDEWVVIARSVQLEFRFDNGYVEQNKYELETAQAAQSRISTTIMQEYFPIIKKAFVQQCHLDLTLDSSDIQLYTSSADICKNNYIYSACSCISNEQCLLESDHSPHTNNYQAGFEYDSHCTSIIRLRNNLIVGLPNNTIRVGYTGHMVCFKRADVWGCAATAHGLSCYDYPIICIKEDDDTDQATRILVLAHELSHTYGAVDHEQKSSPCIMSGDTNNGFSGVNINNPQTYWCAECISNMKSNVNKY